MPLDYKKHEIKTELMQSSPGSEPVYWTVKETGWPIQKIIEWKICLLDFDHRDWKYDTYRDYVYVKHGTKLYSWLNLFDR